MTYQFVILETLNATVEPPRTDDSVMSNEKHSISLTVCSVGLGRSVGKELLAASTA